jgi:hypothetical protein
MRGNKRYTTAYKKKADTELDVYLQKRSPQGILRCPDCGAVYYRRHWSLSVPAQTRKLAGIANFHAAPCPACRKIRDQYPMGEVRIVNSAPEDKREMMRILRNEETRARQKNPLERIMTVRQHGPDEWRIQTTTEKLAQRLGRSLRKARGGRVHYEWSHNNKYVHVVWRKESEKTQKRRT